MKINLEKYSKLKIYKSAGKDCYYDKVSKELRVKTAEETVRMKFVEFLHEKMEVPYKAMEIDVSIADYDSEESGRIDIGVFAHDEEKFDIIMLAVKCLEKGVALTDEVFEEVCNYADIAEASFVALTNGEELEIYYYNEEIDKYEEVKELISYDELCSKLKLEKYPSEIQAYKKIAENFSSNEEAYRYLLEKTDTIGKETKEQYYPIILKLEDLLMNFSDEMNVVETNGYKICDLGTRYSSFGDDASENCIGNYRSFRVESKFGNTQIVSMGVFAFAKIVADLKIGAPLEKTYLTVVVDNFSKQHNSLQLQIDELISLVGKEVFFSDDGSRLEENGEFFNSEDVVEYVRDNDLNIEIENNKIILGKLRIEQEVTINDDSVQVLLANLVRYALLRAEIEG